MLPRCADATPPPEMDYVAARERMVARQIAARGVRDEHVLRAMRSVPRHEFVPKSLRHEAYDDRPLPIGSGQTISQPYIVAVMCELAQLEPGARVLDVGTGSGYQAAVLAAMGAEVYSIEIVEELAVSSAATLERAGFSAVHVRHGDGYQGWSEAAPFRAILVAAAAPRIPPPLIEQLEVGGRLVIPVGRFDQELQVHVRGESGVRVERSFPVRFVPMTGRVRQEEP